MKIVIVQGPALPVPPIRGGAVEKIWFTLGKEFSRRGMNVLHISRDDPDLEKIEISDGVKYVRIKGSSASNNRIKLMLSDFLYSIKVLCIVPKKSFVITNTFFLPVLSLFRPDCFFYVSVHRMPKGQYFLYRCANRFQCVSTAVANELVKQAPWAKHKTKFIPNFVQTKKYAGNGVNWIDRNNVVLFVGRLHPEKGVLELIDAWAKIESDFLSGWVLRIVGPWEVERGGGGQYYFEKILAKAKGCPNKIEVLKPIYDVEKLNSEYSQAKLLVYPTVAPDGEALPLAPLEAMAMGLPVLATDIPCFDDYLINDVNGWRIPFVNGSLVNLDVKMKEVINKIKTDGDKYSVSAISAAEKFNLKDVADVFLEDFNSVGGNSINFR